MICGRCIRLLYLDTPTSGTEVISLHAVCGVLSREYFCFIQFMLYHLLWYVVRTRVCDYYDMETKYISSIKLNKRFN